MQPPMLVQVLIAQRGPTACASPLLARAVGARRSQTAQAECSAMLSGVQGSVRDNVAGGQRLGRTWHGRR